MSRISQKEKTCLAKNLKISRGVKRYYKQLNQYRDITKSTYMQARYNLRKSKNKKDYKERQKWIDKKKTITAPPIPPVPPKPPLKDNEYQFNFADIAETDYETKMIDDIDFHKCIKDYLEKKCYNDDESSYEFDLHITQDYAGVHHSWSFPEWYFDAEIYPLYQIATVICIKLAKMKVTCGFVSQPAVLSIVPVKSE